METSPPVQTCTQGISSSVPSLISKFNRAKSSSKSVVSSPSVGKVGNTSTSWYFVPARSAISNSILDNCKHHRASLSERLDTLNIHFSKSWSLQLMKLYHLGATVILTPPRQSRDLLGAWYCLHVPRWSVRGANSWFTLSFYQILRAIIHMRLIRRKHLYAVSFAHWGSIRPVPAEN